MSDEGVDSNLAIQYGVGMFDHYGDAVLSVFQILTMDNWSVIAYNLMDGFVSQVGAIYCALLIVFGSFFLLNINLAVIMSAFINIQLKETQDKIDDEKKLEKAKQFSAKLHSKMG